MRGLLLGTGAALVALTGAQAADLPVKAKPVQYVKICDLYGAGYFYVPGTDTCMKIGGFVRFNAFWNQANGSTYGISAAQAPAGAFERLSSQDSTFRTRLWLTADVRSQTAWGTLRSYYALQWQAAGPNDAHNATTVNMLRGFIQIAGFTIGRTTSLFDTPDAVAFASLGTQNFPGAAGSGATGINAVQYTAALGNGLSASVGIEGYALRDGAVVNLNTGTGFTPFGAAVVSNDIDSGAGAGSRLTPDLTANLDVTQAWGSARIVGALHSVSGSYYTGAGPGFAAPATCVPASPIACGSPGDRLGWAVGAGFTITAIPGLPGDLFGITATYASGASNYVNGSTHVGITNGNTSTIGTLTDGVFVNGGSIELTEAWGINGAFQHAWSPTLKTSIFAGYTSISHTGAAKNFICNPAAGGGAAAAGVVGGVAAVTPATSGTLRVTNCNPDFSYYAIGSRIFSWDPVPNLNLGLEVVYWNVSSAHAGAAFVPAHGATAAGIRTLGSNEIWHVNFQVQRSFWP